VLVTVIVLSFPRTSNVSSNRARVFTEPPVLAAEPDKTHAGASAGLREGLPEPLTVLRLGPPPMPACSPRSTKPIESMIEICREHAKNVKNWRDGQVALRPAVAGMLEAAGSSAGPTVTCTHPPCARPSKPKSGTPSDP
jgi:hypothetical protein